ncbi:MAG: hypothetical protein AAB340_03445, partial [Patescibacteria group bacterium]
SAAAQGWSPEGIAFYAYSSQVSGAIPVYRSFNGGGVDHFYTTSANESSSAAAQGWSPEGIAFYAYSDGSCISQNQCSDNIDNDQDGAIDYPNDFSCSSASDNDETNPRAQCQDGVDNDGDGNVDYPQDAGCSNKQDNDEFNQIQAACNTNSDCGTNSYIDSPFCQGNSIYRNFKTYTCNNPGTAQAYCSNSTSGQLQQNCSSNQTCSNGSCISQNQCSDNIDNDQDGAIDYPNDFSCSSASDNDETNPRAQCQDGVDNDGDGNVDYPQDAGCSNKQDNDEFNQIQAACNTNSDCGTNSYIDSPFCQGNSIYRNFKTYTCNNPGTAQAYCSNSTSGQLQQNCSSGQTCSNGNCATIIASCLSNSYLQCSGNSIYWYDSCGNRQSLYQACTLNQTCSANTCVTNTYIPTYTNYIFHSITGCINNISYWYDSLGNQQDVYQNCGLTGRTCQNGQCVGQAYTTTAIQSTYARHYRTKCSQDNIYWYDSNGSIQDIYQNCSDNNSCTQDICREGQCQNILKCDGSTCAAGSADYTRYCGNVTISCTVINPLQTPTQDNILTASLSGSAFANLLRNWLLWLLIALILIILFIIIFRGLSFRR